MPSLYDEEAALAALAEQDLAPAPFDPSQYKEGDDIAPLIEALLRCLGEDPERAGLLKTPKRVAAALQFLTKGYHDNLESLVNDAVFESDNTDIVLVKDIEVFSMCEHHILPIYGTVHIAYIPDGKVIGLSKLPRIAEMFARRLQLQEQMTSQIAQALHDVMQPKGVAVISDCKHMCMSMRGVQKINSSTVCRAFTGAFETDASLRQELAQMLGKA